MRSGETSHTHTQSITPVTLTSQSSQNIVDPDVDDPEMTSIMRSKEKLKKGIKRYTFPPLYSALTTYLVYASKR